MCAPHKLVVRCIVYWPASLHSPNAPAPLLLPPPAHPPKRCNPLKCDGQCSSTPTMAAGHALAQSHWHPWPLWWCGAHPPTQGQGWMPLEQPLLPSATHSSMRGPGIRTPRFRASTHLSGLPPGQGLKQHNKKDPKHSDPNHKPYVHLLLASSCTSFLPVHGDGTTAI